MPRSGLRLLAPASDSCATPGCPLAGQGASGFCGPCASVHASVLALCQRLLARDLARLERQAPGLTAAALLALRANRVDRAASLDTAAPCAAMWPPERELAALDALLMELRARDAAS
jgi:hypothetical protein